MELTRQLKSIGFLKCARFDVALVKLYLVRETGWSFLRANFPQ